MKVKNMRKAGKRIFLNTLALIVLLSTASANGAEPLTLADALNKASRSALAEEARVLLSYGRLHYLESQNKSKFELRPQLGLLAFSNPLLLATNLGASLLWQRFQAPGSFALQNAEFDVLASEIAHARRRSDVQVEAARTFFELLELQESEERARELHRVWQSETDRAAGLLRASRITVQDKAAFDVALVEIEMDAADFEARRRAKAVDLARLLGLNRDMGLLRVTGEGLAEKFDTDLSRDVLIDLAIERREELSLLRRKMSEMPDPPKERRVRFDSFGANYAHIGQDTTDALGVSGNDYLLGGHTGRTDLGFSISLRSNGEQRAAAEITAARRQVLKIELDEAEDSIRAEVEKFWFLAAASRQRVELSSRKLELKRKSLGAIKIRVDRSLGSLPSLLAGELDVLRQQAEYDAALAEQRARAFHLMAATGETFQDSRQSDEASPTMEQRQ